MEDSDATHTKDLQAILTQFSAGIYVLINYTYKLGNNSGQMVDNISKTRQVRRRVEEQMDARQVKLFGSH